MTLRALTIPLLVYTLACALASPPAAAQTLDAAARAEVEALREGEMRKLAVLEAAIPAPDTAFIDAAGAETTLAASNGKLRVVNFWATWCAPCREEMPSLAALQAGLAGAAFEVMPIAMGRSGNSPEEIARFFAEAGIAGLQTATDPTGRLAREMGVPGLPVTVILNREGDEIARLMGGADWNGPSARAIIANLLAR